MSPLTDWLKRIAEPAPQDHWTTKLWNSAWDEQENVLSFRQIRDPPELSEDDESYLPEYLRAPTRCVVMRGIDGEFEGHDISATLMRSEYLNVMQALIDFIQDTPLDEDAFLDNYDYTCLRSIPENPFASYQVEKDRAKMVISGSAGSGKSLFLHPLLGLRLNAKLPTAFQVGEGPIYLFTELGCHVIKSSASAEDGNDLALHVPGIWCLTEGESPPSLYQSDLGTIVHVVPASQRGLSLIWPDMLHFISSMGAVENKPRVRLFFMPVFALREAKLARDLQVSGPKPTDEQLEDWFLTFTPNLRVAFANAHNQTYYRSGLMERVPFDTEMGLVNFLRRMNVYEDVGDNASEFFHWEVQGPDYTAEGTFVSRAIMKMLLGHLGARNKDEELAILLRLFAMMK